MTPSADAALRRVGDGAVLVLAHSGRVFELNDTAARAWELAASGLTRSAILSRLVEEYSGDRDAIAADLQELFDWLGAQGLLQA